MAAPDGTPPPLFVRPRRGSVTAGPVPPRRGRVGALASHRAARADALGQALPKPEVLPLFFLEWKEQPMGAELTEPGTAGTSAHGTFLLTTVPA
jgi:hypothetical protein